MRVRVLLAVLLLGTPVFAQGAHEEVESVAQRYLDALTGKGSEDGKTLLLGGVTTSAHFLSLDAWKIVSREAPKRERGDLAAAARLLKDLDAAAQAAFNKVSGSTDDLESAEVSQEAAAKLMKPTQAKAQKLVGAFPVLAYAARVGKDVYFHPKNPMRRVLAQAGKTGRYELQLHRMWVESSEGGRDPKKWKLKIVRFRTDALDTGWKVLPAADWNGD